MNQSIAPLNPLKELQLLTDTGKKKQTVIFTMTCILYKMLEPSDDTCGKKKFRKITDLPLNGHKAKGWKMKETYLHQITMGDVSIKMQISKLVRKRFISFLKPWQATAFISCSESTQISAISF